MKLLSKASDERYQTAAGLEADLERCLAQWRTAARIDDFPIGLDDVPDRLVIAEKVYGREKEARVLLDAFERVAGTARPEVGLVAGPAGGGETTRAHGRSSAGAGGEGFFLSRAIRPQPSGTPSWPTGDRV